MKHSNRTLILCLLGVAALVVAFNIHSRLTSPQGVAGENGMTFERETMFYEKLDDGSVQCMICFRSCVIPEGGIGFCRNRKNRDGVLYNVVYGRPAAIQVDPIEKEPLHHFHPGTSIFCVGTAGCNFRCKFCHNWRLSQRSVDEMTTILYDLSPEDLVGKALSQNMTAISFTYNEPTSFYEYAYDVARLAQERGLRVIVHTNGSMKPDPLRTLLEYVDAVTVDLKAFEQEFYGTFCEAELAPVLETLQIIREEGVWLEIVNLIVPEQNDDPETIRAMCRWIRDTLGAHTPLHFNRFFPAYRLTSLSPTPIETLEMAHAIALEEGLQYVFIGNAPGLPQNSSYCHECGATLIERHHHSIGDIRVEDGKCPDCNTPIPGVWE